MRYTAYSVLTEPARASAQLWRLLLGVALAVACFFAMGFSYFNLLAELVTQGGWPQFNAEIDAGTTPRGMMALLGLFGFIILSLALVLKTLHGRGLGSLFGPSGQALRDFARVATALAALYVLIWLLPEPEAMAPRPNLPALRWLALLPLALPLILVQVTAEELAFRGYLQSQLAARYAHPAIWLAVPAAIFGLLHYDPAVQGGNAIALAVTAGLFGLAAGDVTARSGTLGAAIALHLSVNIPALLVTAPADSLYGLALQTYPFTLADTAARSVWLPYDTLVLLCSWLTARLALAR